MDAILLSHLAAWIITVNMHIDDDSSPLSVFLSLLPGPIPNVRTPPVCISTPLANDLLERLYVRFGNNNFAIQSYLSTVGHGIFPTASRAFNHSCLPNAAAKYQFASAQPVVMEVIALRDIEGEEEICMPYVDPALLQSRQRICKLSYGFVCVCRSCQDLDSLKNLPTSPNTKDEVMKLGNLLREYVGLENDIDPSLPYRDFGTLPTELVPALQETYITSLSEIFSRTSHEGHYSIANNAGLNLLALYLLIYPPNYPQIGVHILEMAKTRWNGLVTSTVSPGTAHAIKEQVRVLLRLGRDILQILGPGGDGDEKIGEADILQGLLDDDE
ncbi:hypothetical protein AX17_006245 [Amanita inopinata Kibby_2008]|nr:hypothetical protein AX17_006245 [Amanita inopinata Kibby_2008]